MGQDSKPRFSLESGEIANISGMTPKLICGLKKGRFCVYSMLVILVGSLCSNKHRDKYVSSLTERTLAQSLMGA